MDTMVIATIQKIAISGVFIALITTCLVFFTVIFTVSAFKPRDQYQYKVAMVTDYADVDDNSFNQQIYEGCKYWCDNHNIPFSYYKPSANTDVERRKSVELAIERGCTDLFLPGFTFAPIIADYAPKYPTVSFIGIDILPFDLPVGWEPGDNVFCFSYHEEII